jgi:hypothetical protein
MHMLNVIEEETYSEIKESVNLSQAGEFSDLTEGLRAFGSFDGGYDEFNTARTEYFEHKEFNFSKDQSIESLQTGLPIHVTNAWSQCIAYANDDRSGFKIWCSFLSKTIAIIVVEYHHTAGAPRQISVRNSFLTGATSNLSQMPGKLYDEGAIINEGTSWWHRMPGSLGWRKKRKEGDSYNPDAFSDRKEYDDLMAWLEKRYHEKLKEK